MAWDKKKSAFVGVRLSEGEREKLETIQGGLGLNKTEVLLKGLDLMGQYYSLGLDTVAVNDMMHRLSSDARKHAGQLQDIRSREEFIRDLLRQMHEIDRIIDSHGSDEGELIQIMLDVQARYGWLPRHVLWWIDQRLGVGQARIMQIATFYKAFSLEPRGRHLVRVCLGTACHVRGGESVREACENALGIESGRTTSDGRFTLEAVNCLGCCALGPVMMVDGEYHGNLKPGMVREVLAGYE